VVASEFSSLSLRPWHACSSCRHEPHPIHPQSLSQTGAIRTLADCAGSRTCAPGQHPSQVSSALHTHPGPLLVHTCHIIEDRATWLTCTDS
jgi:hypothetical protein